MRYRSDYGPLELAPEASEIKGAVAEYSDYVSETAKMRRLPEGITQAQIIRDEFRRRNGEVEHIVVESGARGRQLCANWYGTHRDQMTSRDITPMGQL